MGSWKVMNTLQAQVWDKGLEIPKCILMKAHESKMRALLQMDQSPMKQGARIHERKGSDIVIGSSSKWT